MPSQPEPLTIYECPKCGHRSLALRSCAGPAALGSGHKRVDRTLVRVFRGEDVRPLWEACESHPMLMAVSANFPAPEEWKR